MKKVYQKPETEVVKIGCTQMLAASEINGTPNLTEYDNEDVPL